MNRNIMNCNILPFCSCAIAFFTASLVLLGSASASRSKVIYRFIGGSDGSNPLAGLVADHAGNLYGATSSGGNSACQGGCGTLFELTPNLDGSWTETQLYSFTGGNDGAFPETSLIFDQAGNLYGTTIHGGASSDGTVFRLSPPAAPGSPWTETVLYNFVGDRDGYYCFGGLVFDPAGNLYGAGFFGGRYGGGTVFQLVPPVEGDAWSLNVLHSFQGIHDGLDPYGALILDRQSSIYGATHDGKVFKLKSPSSGQTNWTLQVIYSSSSQFSVGALLAGKQGALFGTSTLGGSANRGTVFQLTPPAQAGHAWTVSTLYQFAGGSDGELPLNGLIADRSGNLYGTTEGGGAFSAGTVFKLSPATQGQAWIETLLHNFAGGSDGAGPGAGLLFGKQGALYGTTQSGGSNNNGTVFKVVP
jgi:uncharacterized repeat protein (TIGR03803 family)